MNKSTASLPFLDDSESQWIELHRTLVSTLEGIRDRRKILQHPFVKENQQWIESILSTHQLFPAQRDSYSPKNDFIRIVAWNIERGTRYAKILDCMQNHPILRDCDVFLLSEVDYGMVRSGNRHVARDLGQDLGLHAAYGPAFLNIDKGNGSERRIIGDNALGLQGHAILSRFPLSDLRLIQLPDTEDHLGGEERQFGHETALVATAQTHLGAIDMVTSHLSLRSSRKDRVQQIKVILDALAPRNKPALLGGDWNTNTYNANGAWRAILGFWYRVGLGVRNVVINHYPYPHESFERELFQTLEKNGFQFRDFNLPGVCTAHYNMLDSEHFDSMSDWIPQWCFPYIRWALEKVGGHISLNLDWLAGRGLCAENPCVLYDLPKGKDRISDHDPIAVDVRPVQT